MRLSIYTSIRIVTLGFLASTMIAAAVGRSARNPLDSLVLDNKQPWTVAQHMIDPIRGRNLILQTGPDLRIEPDFGEGVSVDLLAVSPFADSRGQREMIGRRRLVAGSGADSMALRVEMARYSFPDAELVESRETDWIPNSMPAWDVRLDRGLRTVFSTGAGFLVRLDWTDERGRSTPHKGVTIEWMVNPPMGEATNIGEPVWVSDPRYPDRLIVNFWGQDPSTEEHHVGLAWIELNRERSGIVDCGILTRRNLGWRNHAISMRSPSVRLDESGAMHLLWMARDEDDRFWSLNKARLVDRPGDRTGGGEWLLGTIEELAETCMPVPAHLDESLRYAYFVVPKSMSCYDGGEWRKAFVGESRGALTRRHGATGARKFETAYRR